MREINLKDAPKLISEYIKYEEKYKKALTNKARIFIDDNPSLTNGYYILSNSENEENVYELSGSIQFHNKVDLKIIVDFLKGIGVKGKIQFDFEDYKSEGYVDYRKVRNKNCTLKEAYIVEETFDLEVITKIENAGFYVINKFEELRYYEHDEELAQEKVIDEFYATIVEHRRYEILI